jgi:hypothetical protein
MHIAAVLQDNRLPLFDRFHEEYAREHGKSAAQYMVDTLRFWHEGKVDIQPQSLRRFSEVRFPSASDSELYPLMCALYDECRRNSPEAYHVSFRIDYNIAESTSYLEQIVEGFVSDDYESAPSYEFAAGMAWICEDDVDRAQTILRNYTRPLGQANYSATRGAVDEFLSRLKAEVLPIPFEQRFGLARGCLSVDYNYRLRKRVGDSFKRLGKKIIFWR